MHIILDKLSYSYNGVLALQNISTKLDLESKCISLIGHNGAGKTTLLNVICNINTNYTGSLNLSDNANVAFLPFNNSIYDNFTVEENLTFWYQIQNNCKYSRTSEKVKTIIEDFNLEELLTRKVITLSSGQKRLVALSCILLGDANIIILDEPFNGLDISTVSKLCTIITQYKNRGVGFIISSHQLDILNKISDETLILKKGELIYDSKTSDTNESIFDLYVKEYE